MRAVVHRDLDHRRPPGLGDRGGDPIPVGGDGHQAGGRQVARRFEPPEQRGERPEAILERLVHRHDPGRRQREELAAAVADHRVGHQAQPEQELIQSPLR